MFRKVLLSKIHQATVTEADLEYEGSLTIPPELLDAAGIVPYEAINVWNVTIGTRLETYAIAGRPGSNSICINGAAAHLTRIGDRIIIACFAFLPSQAVERHEPRFIFLDKNNRIKHQGPELPGPQLRGNGVNYPSRPLD